jgi:beta-glucosidase
MSYHFILNKSKGSSSKSQWKKVFIGVVFISLILLPFLSCGLDKTKKVPKASAVYKNANAEINDRVEDLLSRMTLEEKIGQMTQIEIGSISSGSVKALFLGSVLSGGGGTPAKNTPEAWCDMIDSLQKEALSTRLAIPIIYGTDSVHGHNNLKNATIFPHNIGLGAANDPLLTEKIASASAIETAATGIPWNFAPCLAIARDPRWGRTYESFSQDAKIVAEHGKAFVRGWLSAEIGEAASPIVSAKHFIGDGGTVWKSSTTNNYKLDQGNTIGDDDYLRNELLLPYIDAIQAGAQTVMISFSSWNGVKMHGHKELVTDLLKNELGFEGFVVSDWAGVDQVNPHYYQAVVASVNAGLDMNMVPYNGPTFISTMIKAVEAKDISMKRIDDAVRRILKVKFEMGLFEKPFANRSLIAEIRSPEHLALAREAVAKSLVVLKNDAVFGKALLPIAPNIERIYVAGEAANNIGLQCGGWTIEWQGKQGAITAGTTIFEALQSRYPQAEIIYNQYGQFTEVDENALCIVIASELSYAEGVGDSEKLELPIRDTLLIERMSETFSRLALVVFSGRPIILEPFAENLSTIVAAWLPGTEGAGVVDILSGDMSPTGTLSFDWASSVSQLPIERFISGEEKPQWPIGYGLTW